MKNFLKIAAGLDVLPLLHAVQTRQDLWNKRRWRTTYDGTPHADVDDIWLRYSDEAATHDPTRLDGVVNDTRPIFYPEWNDLPQARPLVFGMMARLQAYELGRVLITRLRPGGRILPHADAAGDYTDQADGGRYHVVLSARPGSLFRAGDETVQMQPGEAWWFNHLAEHEVINNGADDRIHLLIDTRNA